MGRKRIVLVLLSVVGLSANIFSYSPYLYLLGVLFWRPIGSDLTIEFSLNSSRDNGGMDYGEGEDNFLDLFMPGYKEDGTFRYFNRRTIKSGDGIELFSVHHASHEFAVLDPFSQLRFMFKEIALYADDKKYLIDLEKLDIYALRVYTRNGDGRIDFDITEEFLGTHCILQPEPGTKPPPRSSRRGMNRVL